MTLADKALYVSKEAGRNQVHIVQLTANPEEICNRQSTTGADAAEIDALFFNYVKI